MKEGSRIVLVADTNADGTVVVRAWVANEETAKIVALLVGALGPPMVEHLSSAQDMHDTNAVMEAAGVLPTLFVREPDADA